MKYLSIIALASLCCTSVQAGNQAVTHTFDGAFSDATFAVENAIIGRGLVIDYVSHTGEMLNRTASDVGSDVELFKEADIFLFCSAQLSRKVMEADPMNIAHCPYGIFVAQTQGQTMVGYRTYPEGVMKEVEALLESIVQEALE